MNEIASILCGQDNDSYMVASCEKKLYEVPDGVFCAKCGWKKEWKYTRPDFELKIKKYDVSFTYDGACIVSSKIREIMFSKGRKNLIFFILFQYIKLNLILRNEKLNVKIYANLVVYSLL